MLPLIDLSQAEIDRIVGQVPGGIANIQDIYALSPLQEDILFHHLLAREGDPYLLIAQMAFADRERLDRYLSAVQQVVNRHDILRTGFVWEHLSTPAQVVWRQAPLPVTELTLDPVDGPITEQLAQRFDPRQHRIDLRQAPLLRFVIAQDSEGRWLMVQLLHHLIGDHSTLEVMRSEVQAFVEGRGDALPTVQPFRNLVAQARLGVSPFAILIPLQSKGTRSPLFCIHPGLGLSWCYIGLSKPLGTDQPLYGLQARGFDGGEPLAPTIDAMASDYLEQIRRIQPKGPYHLLGWSFGGYVAHSMAAQLEQQGEKVALLALLDSNVDPDYLSKDKELEVSPDALRAQLASRYGEEAFVGMDEHGWGNAYRITQNHACLLKSFTPSIYGGDMLFFRATLAEDESSALASPLAWKPYVLGNMEVFDIHCKHGEIDRPEPMAVIGRILARKLNELLNQKGKEFLE
jgi:thioesterase domain-containing protein